MSVVKDLFLLFLFLVLIIKYLRLNYLYKQQREYFIKTLSHDLRISALAQLRALEIAQKSLPCSDLIYDIYESCKYSLEMITLLVNTYRYEKGESVLNYKNFNICTSVEKNLENLSSLLKEKDLCICNKLSKNIFINADLDTIEKTIKYLLTTSICCSERNNKIIVSGQEFKDKVQIRIAYTGQCLTNEECSRMFNRNSRFSAVGHGIKMHYCKKIIDFHKGAIQVGNLDKNINYFTITLPNFTKRQKPKAPYLQRLQLSSANQQ